MKFKKSEMMFWQKQLYALAQKMLYGGNVKFIYYSRVPPNISQKTWSESVSKTSRIKVPPLMERVDLRPW